jgi:hypothetical protein
MQIIGNPYRVAAVDAMKAGPPVELKNAKVDM